MANNTVTVDVNTLQILNDRICQTLDALNQVRWSSFASRGVNPYMTAGVPTQGPATFGPSAMGTTSHMAFNPYQTVAPSFNGISAFGTPVSPYAPAFAGMSAFGPTATPYATTPVHGSWGFGPYVSRSDITMNGSFGTPVPTGI